MKNIYKICAWNMRRTYKIVLCTWGAMAILEVMAVVFSANNGMYSAYQSVKLWMLFTLGYIVAVMASVLPGIIAAYTRGGQGFTVAGLPIRRSAILYGNILSGLIYAVATIASQIAILMAMFYPVAAIAQKYESVISNMESQGSVYFIQPHAAQFLTFMRSALISIIAPHTLASTLALLVLVLGTTVTVHCILAHGKKARLVGMVLCLGSACVGVFACLVAALSYRSYKEIYLFFVVVPVQAIIIAGSIFWALRDMRKAKHL